MRRNIHYTHCPVCGSDRLEKVLVAKDHTVSSETFTIVECSGCSLRITQDAPAAESIGDYYKSEEYISHTNTAKGLVNRIYHWARRITIRSKCKTVEKHTRADKGRLLDLGSGVGSFVHAMKQRGWDALGLEPDEGARAVARERYGENTAPIEQFYSLPAGSFDAISMWHVLEHVHDLQGYVQQLGTLLKPNGRLFIAVPNYTSQDAEIYQECWAAYDVPRHLYHFSPRAMETLIKKNGLQLRAMLPMWLDSYYISLLSSKYRYGKSRFLSAGWNGTRSNLRAWADVKRCSSIVYVVSR